MIKRKRKTKYKIINTKSQIPNKFQYLKSKYQNSFEFNILDFDIISDLAL